MGEQVCTPSRLQRPKPRSWLNCHSAAAPLFVLGFVEFSPTSKVSGKEKGLCHDITSSVAGTVMGTL